MCSENAVIACVTGQYDCDRIINAAKELADSEGCELRVLSVLRPAPDYTLISGQLEYLYRVAKQAGGDMTFIFDENAPKAAAHFARENRAVRIVSGMHDGGSDSFLIKFNALCPEVSISMVDKDRNVYSMDVSVSAR